MKNSLEKIEQQTEQQTEALRARLDAIDTICKKMLMYLRQVHAHNKVVGQIINLFFWKKVFCKRNKYLKRRLEGLIKCAEMRTMKFLLDAATDKQDFEMICLTSADLIAQNLTITPPVIKTTLLKE